MFWTTLARVSLFTSFLLLPAAIVLGALIGISSPGAGASLGDAIDHTVLTLILLLFFELQWRRQLPRTRDARFLLLAWCANFLFLPLIGFAIASIFFAGKPLFFTGLIIYFMAPCTDWFLGFTRLAHGNSTLGAMLIPINLITQLLLYPVYLQLFTRWQVDTTIVLTGKMLLEWFVLPFLAATVFHLILAKLLPRTVFPVLLTFVCQMVSLVIAVLVIEIFAAHTGVIRQNLSEFTLILAAVFIFFVKTWSMAEWLSKRFRLGYPEHALLTMTTAARNAPLMLGVTAVAIPNQPIIYTAIIIGMLVEFPHLIMLRHLLLRKRSRMTRSNPPTPPTAKD